MLGLQPVPTLGEIFLWLAFAIPMSLYVLWPSPRSMSKRSATAAAAA